jgi:metal-sulfur cluster biosynthetic enzyme
MNTDDDLRSRLLRQLERVIEPCSVAMGNPANICEMGLIEGVTLIGGRARVVLCLTDPSCINYDALMQLDAVKSVEVTQTTEVLWTPDRVRRNPGSQRIRFEQRGTR